MPHGSVGAEDDEHVTACATTPRIAHFTVNPGRIVDGVTQVGVVERMGWRELIVEVSVPGRITLDIETSIRLPVIDERVAIRVCGCAGNDGGIRRTDGIGHRNQSVDHWRMVAWVDWLSGLLFAAIERSLQGKGEEDPFRSHR